VSKNSISTSRSSRLATLREPVDVCALSDPVAAGQLAQRLDRQAVGDHREDRALDHRALHPPAAGRLNDRLPDPEALPHSRSANQQAPIVRESNTLTSPSPPLPAATASAGSRNRLIDRTRRASASRSTWSVRPKRCTIRARGTPVPGSRSFWASARYDTSPTRIMSETHSADRKALQIGPL
jgi:hypothetical protein